jgi:primosomal protein N' (replication factor Y)
MALIVRASRLVGSRERGGVVMLQTFVPDHPLVKAVAVGDVSRLWPAELDARRLLGLPPFRALASVEGADAAEFVTATGLESAPTPKGCLVRSDSWDQLGAALADTPRPKGSRLRVAVDPPRA